MPQLFLRFFRYLPHIINLSVKAVLKVFGTPSAFEWDNKDFSDEDDDNDNDNGWLDMSCIEDEEDHEEYIEMLKTDVIAAARHLVTTCHVSGQCREGFHQTIEEGNKMACLGEGDYAWSHFSVIWTLGGLPPT